MRKLIKITIGIVAALVILLLFCPGQRDRHSGDQSPIGHVGKDSQITFEYPKGGIPTCGPDEDYAGLDQGLPCEQRAAFWFMSQGSQLLRYGLFKGLHEKNSPTLFKDTLVTKYHYIK